MNKKQIITYIIVLFLSLMFIYVVALNQEPTVQQKGKCCDIDKIMMNITSDQSMLSSEWIEIQEELEKSIGYMNVYEEYVVPINNNFKSYMPYTSITSVTSSQHKLQNQYAYTGDYGIRQVNGRFCIAIGTFSNARVGTYVDLILENEIIIPCIVGDFKANVHTDSSNMVTGHNGCVSEFIVEKERLPYVIRNNDNTGTGNMSHCKEEWNSPVEIIKVYEKNVFDGE